MKQPKDPFLTDAMGSSRFCKDLLKRNWKGVDYSLAIGWAARCAAHWAMRSLAWKELAK